MFIAYHREALETLQPWVLDFDESCTWSSQLMQLYEANLAYRNQMLWFTGLTVANAAHRPYPKDCVTSGAFAAVWASINSSLPAFRRHCLPATDDTLASFPKYGVLGFPRPKLRSYTLHGTAFKYSGAPKCSTGPGINFGDVAAVSCCSVNEFIEESRGSFPRSEYHGRIIARPGTSSVYHFVWENTRWDFEGLDTVLALGFQAEDVIRVSASSLIDALVPVDTRGAHAVYLNFPPLARISVEDSDIVLFMRSDGVAQLSAQSGTVYMSLPLWRLRYLPLALDAHAAVAAERARQDNKKK
jgi:hypothetical protein